MVVSKICLWLFHPGNWGNDPILQGFWLNHLVDACRNSNLFHHLPRKHGPLFRQPSKWLISFNLWILSHGGRLVRRSIYMEWHGASVHVIIDGEPVVQKALEVEWLLPYLELVFGHRLACRCDFFPTKTRTHSFTKTDWERPWVFSSKTCYVDQTHMLGLHNMYKGQGEPTRVIIDL